MEAPRSPTVPDGAGPLPASGVAFPRGFRARLEALARGRRRRTVHREGAGSALSTGLGFDLVGYRPYRAGEDLRALDHALLARTDRAFVRVTRREAGARWAVVLDTSASMGLGAPGKLQRAAEVAAGLAHHGLRRGAEVALVASTAEGPAPAPLARRADLERGLAWLEARTAAGRGGALAAAADARVRGADRVAVVGDLLDEDPSALDRLPGGRRLAVAQVLAPDEVEPPDGPGTLVCPESGARRDVEPSDRAAYARALDAWREAWRARCVRRGAVLASGTSARPFERWIEELDAWT